MGVAGQVVKGLFSGGKGNMSAIGIAGGLLSAPFTYADQKEEGHSSLYSAGYAGVEAAGWLFAEPLMWGLTLAQLGGWAGKEAVQEAHENRDQKVRLKTAAGSNENGVRTGTLGGNFVDSEQAYTMRQRSSQVMRQHKLATESILGSEARQLHR